MEDFGEYTPLDSAGAAGTPGHRPPQPLSARLSLRRSRVAASAGRPIVRFQRSGWTGAAPCAQVVWGGDPTTSWGFDGLRSAVRQALSMGLSGVSLWGSDIGGFFALFENRLTPELLTRWVQFGAVSGVMRTEADGIDIPAKQRPQVWDPDQLANWRRYAKLRTQLYPYLLAAEAAYRRSGMPLMRQLSLAYPGDRERRGREDEFLFGPDLLAAPVLEPGATDATPLPAAGPLARLLAHRSPTDERDGSLRHPGARLIARRADPEGPGPAGAAAAAAAGRHGPAAAAGRRRHAQRIRRRGDHLVVGAPPAPHPARLPPGSELAPASSGIGRVRSREVQSGWLLRLAGATARSYQLQASMRTLRRPFAPCAVTVDGRRLRKPAWAYDRAEGVLSAAFGGRDPELIAWRSCRG